MQLTQAILDEIAMLNTRPGVILQLRCWTLTFQRQPSNFKHLFPAARQHECQREDTVTQISSPVAWKSVSGITWQERQKQQSGSTWGEA